MRDHYEVLGVSRNVDEAGLKKAFRKLALRYHPDRNPDDPEAEASFKEVGEAYAVLSDPQKRLMYDHFGRGGLGRLEEEVNFRDGSALFHLYDLFEKILAQGRRDDLRSRVEVFNVHPLYNRPIPEDEYCLRVVNHDVFLNSGGEGVDLKKGVKVKYDGIERRFGVYLRLPRNLTIFDLTVDNRDYSKHRDVVGRIRTGGSLNLAAVNLEVEVGPRQRVILSSIASKVHGELVGYEGSKLDDRRGRGLDCAYLLPESGEFDKSLDLRISSGRLSRFNIRRRPD